MWWLMHQIIFTLRRFVGNFLPSGGSEFNGDFPDWLLMEVLCRLPVKFVFRLKSVSKQWLSLISDPSFSGFYVSRASPQQQPPWAILFDIMPAEACLLSTSADGSLLSTYLDYQQPALKPLGDMYSDDFRCPDPDDYYHALTLPGGHQGYRWPRICYDILAVSDDGLVLYGYVKKIARYYVCNPATKQWFGLPVLEDDTLPVMYGFLTRVGGGGVLTSYTVVRFYRTSVRTNVLKLGVFSSDNSRWEVITVHSDHAIDFRYGRRKSAVCFNDNLHWIDDWNDGGQVGILVYDLYKDRNRCRIIDFPDDRKEHNHATNQFLRSLVIHRGRLNYTEVTSHCGFLYTLEGEGEGEGESSYDNFFGFKIWVLEDYDGGGHWTLQHRIRYPINLLHFTKTSGKVAKPICFHPFDPDIVLLAVDYFIVSYNIRTARFDVVGSPLDFQDVLDHNLNHEWPISWHWPFLLVLPHWPISFPSHLFEGADEHYLLGTNTDSSKQPEISADRLERMQISLSMEIQIRPLEVVPEDYLIAHHI